MLTIVDFLKGEVMKKFLCTVSYTMLEAGKLYELDEYGRAVLCGAHHVVDDSIGKFVDTFERDGVEWIKHTGGECPVPWGWKVHAASAKGSIFTDAAHPDFRWSGGFEEILAYRIISTGEQEDPTDVVEQEESEESNIQNWSKVQARDWRDPSPQEAAYAEKVAAMEPKPEAPKTFPALREIDYNPPLLGVGQFLKGAE